ncbi:MAG: glycosyltransferase family 2 protein [Caldilineae bacterium]|nr:MAG: glycosyltransferase family 2 protein [Caldilineae bacterium]
MAERRPISVVIITLNEARNLPDCIASVDWADEILVVDSGSTDGTVALAEKLGARVIHQEWLGFGRQKQFATEQATHDWVLNLDADERVSTELARSIRAVLSASKSAAAYQCNFRHRLLGRALRHGEAWPDPHVRLYDRRRAHWADVPIHEHVLVDGSIESLPGWIEHCTADSIAEMIDKINRYTDIQAEQMLGRGIRARLAGFLFRPFWRFFRAYVLRLGFLDGAAGLLHAGQAALTTFLKYAKALELQQRQ